MSTSANKIAVRLENVSRSYKLYNAPKDRLKEALNPWGKKYHREFFALKNINLEIRKGEILGIVGQNGAGKSTLLKIVSGVLQPTSGKANTWGALSTFLDLGAGFNPEFSGLQNLYFSGTMMGYTRKEMEEKISDILEFADIGEFIHQPLQTYSSGMIARLGFSLAINIKPEILVLDEVLAVGDELFRRRCFAKLEEFFKKGCTVLYVAHSVPTINQLCTRAAFIDKGELILTGEPFMVTSQYQRFLFAPKDQKEQVRNEIMELEKDEEAKHRFIRESDNKQKTAVAAPEKPLEKESELQEPDETEQKAKKIAKDTPSGPYPFYLKGFQSKSKVEARIFPVDVFDTHIRTLDGKKVNVLVMDETYIYSYKVTFQDSFTRLFFTMAIKDEKGMNISSAETRLPGSHLLQSVKKGQSYRVDWTFTCTLMPREYYTNTGVFMINDQQEITVLHRTTDALAFRVQQSPGHTYKGFVHLSQQYNVHEVHECRAGEQVETVSMRVEPENGTPAKQKLIVVAYPVGRVGSSATMGLLKKTGVNVGETERLTPACNMNPKGFFELKSQHKFLEKAFKGWYPEIVPPPSLAEYDAIGEAYFQEYDNLLQAEFTFTQPPAIPVAVKSQRFLTLAFLQRLKDKYDIRIIVLDRNEKDQVDSIIRVWKQAGGFQEENADYEFIKDYLNKWKHFSLEVIRHYNFNCTHLSFDRLMAEPEAVAGELSDVLDLNRLTPEQVNHWLDASLVNREKLSG